MTSLLGFVSSYGLDGIDINHEGCPGGIRGSCVGSSKAKFMPDSACYAAVWGPIIQVCMCVRVCACVCTCVRLYGFWSTPRASLLAGRVVMCCCTHSVADLLQ